jgi:hypothetical protein
MWSYVAACEKCSYTADVKSPGPFGRLFYRLGSQACAPCFEQDGWCDGCQGVATIERIPNDQEIDAWCASELKRNAEKGEALTRYDRVADAAARSAPAWKAWAADRRSAGSLHCLACGAAGAQPIAVVGDDGAVCAGRLHPECGGMFRVERGTHFFMHRDALQTGPDVRWIDRDAQHLGETDDAAINNGALGSSNEPDLGPSPEAGAVSGPIARIKQIAWQQRYSLLAIGWAAGAWAWGTHVLDGQPLGYLVGALAVPLLAVFAVILGYVVVAMTNGLTEVVVASRFVRTRVRGEKARTIIGGLVWVSIALLLVAAYAGILVQRRHQ